MVKIAKELLLNKGIEKVIVTFLVIFGLFLLFQIVKKMFGGSWTTEDIILGLLVFNLGCLFTVGILVAQLKSDHSHLKGQFKSLATDFKVHVKKKK